MIEISHTAHTNAPRAEVWKRLADLQNWHEWGPWTKTTIEGDIRHLTSDRKRLTGKPYVMVERVTALEPQERFEYDLLSGLPLKNYHGVVLLNDAEDGGTDITWSSSFDPAWPVFGGLWRGGMLKVITGVSEALARATQVKE
jgi:Polyketide cyclase / dehydrase and lipid transport